MIAQQKLSELHTLNKLIALVSGAERTTSEHIQSAINFTLEDAAPGGPSEETFYSAADELVKLYQGQAPHSFSFYHCDLRKDDYDPLWLREKILQGLRTLSGYPRTILLITGLRRMICPPGKNWTRKRQAQYEQALCYIQDTTQVGTSPKTRMHMLFL